LPPRLCPHVGNLCIDISSSHTIKQVRFWGCGSPLLLFPFLFLFLVALVFSGSLTTSLVVFNQCFEVSLAAVLCNSLHLSLNKKVLRHGHEKNITLLVLPYYLETNGQRRASIFYFLGGLHSVARASCDPSGARSTSSSHLPISWPQIL
jgi:hypothetical protein